MDAELLEYLETAIREAAKHLAELPDEVEAAVDEVGSLALDHAREAMEEALTRIERAKVLG